MNSTFKQYNKLKIPLIKETIKIFTDKNHLLGGDTEDELRDYKCCVVGTVRERLGLTTEYERHHLDYCSKCVELANQMPTPIGIYSDKKEGLMSYTDINYIEKFHWDREMQEQKEIYEGLLLELKQHLKLDHNKELA